jgi:mxaK protein
MGRLMHKLLSPWLLWPALLLSLAGAMHGGYALFTLNQHNRLLETPEQIVAGDDTDPVLIFAKAHQLQQQGDPLEALRLYGGIQQRGEGDFRARVHYNLGTLYLRDAARLWKDRGLLEYVRINTLLAASKEHLREALVLNPEFWDARYNLEYAFRITPPPKERSKNDFQGNKGSVFATLPSIPGGGP